MKTTYAIYAYINTTLRKFVFLSFVLSLIGGQVLAQVGIGTTEPEESAQLHIESKTKGILIPRLNTGEMNGIQNPTEGLLIYNTDSPGGFYYYDGSSWQPLVPPPSSASGPVAFAATTTASEINTSTQLGNWLVSKNENVIFDPVTGVVTINESGFYRVSAIVNYSLLASLAVDIGTAKPSIELRNITHATNALSAYFPVLDVNMLVLNIRAILGAGSVVLTGDVYFESGDQLGLFYVADGLAFALNLGEWNAPVYWSMSKL